MHGNIYQWCEDWYDAKAYNRGNCKDPLVTSEGAFRVFRGGSWNSVPQDCRSADRGRGVLAYRHDGMGFRVARSSDK